MNAERHARVVALVKTLQQAQADLQELCDSEEAEHAALAEGDVGGIVVEQWRNALEDAESHVHEALDDLGWTA